MTNNNPESIKPNTFCNSNKDTKSLLTNHLQQAHVALTEEKIVLLTQYIELLFEWSPIYNLTAAHNKEDFIVQHILDSLAAGPFLEGDHIIDVGTGAGLPGIPLAIYYPDKHFSLLDSRGKKIRFLQAVVARLKLKNVVIVNQRVETYQPETLFSTVITRAFASLTDMLQMTGHLCHPSGLFLAMKGRLPAKELAQITPAFTVKFEKRLIIPGMDKERHIIGVIHKENNSGENSRISESKRRRG